MQSADSVFAGSIPALYDRYLGPALFDPYAADLARRVVDLSAGAVLETAAGTGRVTRVLAQALPDSVSIVATDLNQAMLDFATAQPGGDRVSWRQADALALPFEGARFDAVVCQFGVMFFPDKPAGYREAARVLKPGGRFLFNVWDAIEANTFALVTTEALSGQFPENPPLFLPRTPYAYYRTDVIGAVYAAIHSDVDIPCGCCTFYGGIRAEFDHTWSDVLQIQNKSDLGGINLLFSVGVRY